MILCKLGEFEEFAEALFGQLSVEINEEKEIVLTINNILSIRKYLDSLLMYFFKSLSQKETE